MKRRRPVIVPVFIPFMGCRTRCVFCRQDRQTGVAADSASILADGLVRAWSQLRWRAQNGLAPAELAFYGGTFTAIPGEALDACLAFARRATAAGLITSFRCSTRPDCLDGAILDRLLASGLGAMELGAQSFDERALHFCGRAYSGAEIERACAFLRKAGVPFCIQLLPGLPGDRPGLFLDDVGRAIGLGAAMLRFYPCVVLKGTPLAAIWRAGRYRPWSLQQSVDALARGWLMAESSGVSVIRMGLAPEPGLEKDVLAGPLAQDLGSRARGQALVLAVRRMSARVCGTPVRLRLPHACSGYYLGHAGQLAPQWRELGLEAGAISLASQDCLELLVSIQDF